MRVVGIEGTAWCASAAVFDTERDRVRIESDAYEPESGGIHPREAAEHMREAIPAVIETALEDAEGPIDAVAFARGPGIGPCLRIVGSAARALAQGLDVPLVGVNHMVAHLEIGRHRSGFESPVCLNASGANAHVLGYHNGRYRVLGETMDTGVGNALDKFTRHVGWSHPGGPKVEDHAKRGEYVPFPYVVKGMDFSFSGIMSAAKDAYDDGTPVEDVCRGLEETVFGMLTEVAERALSLTGRDELVLGGGVGQNARLRGMLAAMCEQRGAGFYAPEPRFLRDNAGMIAVLGAKMYRAGDTLDVAESAIDPDYRPDEVAVTWRDDAEDVLLGGSGGDLRGAEAIVEADETRVTKTRRPKGYRHDALDARLRRERTTGEARLLSEARRVGVPTPVLSDVDVPESTLRMERVGDTDLRDALNEARIAAVAEHLAAIHDAGFVHGDPTTRNARVTRSVTRDERAGAEATHGQRASRDGRAERVHLIDFGLGYYTDDVEDYAMDLRVFEGSIRGTASDPEPLVAAAEAAYREAGDPDVVARLREVEERGRYR
ncbi:bifunctional N(6)-L-threonylcarbamoyladenine synthase/serine/threonine protein kinase [Halarchaeum nitratireducens]|uniref:Probable bifunctional tRNA threonylcarbamoyladenosine biosynthesis protein n=1 Tax=Halarchaeum nitratireducens TaxID=489913 RepID=A0A830G8U2_9EURY|nr:MULTISPECIES: bifunctional N(6)-L-threonylcarbamoyladenine synthase/serine/threonine protein kinase [Halarchaeum]MBP2250317.1 N6-L-threonylcarbamoyladenine synthase/protein kinase Bud32 [Halarchaeum solikamskense]GGN12687.1 serine/threonine protein kinase [Halarchaeum nitratireducens]